MLKVACSEPGVSRTRNLSVTSPYYTTAPNVTRTVMSPPRGGPRKNTNHQISQGLFLSKKKFKNNKRPMSILAEGRNQTDGLAVELGRAVLLI